MPHRKYILLLIVLVFIVVSPLVGADPYANRQKIYPVDSLVYRNISLLYTGMGIVQPSTTGPWSGDELLRMLQFIPYDQLDAGQRLLYDATYTELCKQPKIKTEGTFGLSPWIKIIPEIYYHSNNVFDTESDWSYGFNDRNPFLEFDFEGWATPYFYGYVDLSLGLTRYHKSDSPVSLENTPEAFYQQTFCSNIPMLGIASLGELSMNMPYRAFIAAGGSHWSLQVGRDQLSWGMGESGNLVLSDNVPVQSFGRFTAYNNSFKYTFVASFFPHPVNYTLPDTDDQAVIDAFIASHLHDPNYQMQGLSMFMGHRFEIRLFEQHLMVALSETIMYQSVDGYFDLQVLNPLMLFHNLYIRGNANSLLSLELDFAPCTGLNVYAQFVMDDLAVGSEPTSGKDANPNAIGGMVGAKFSVPFEKGTFFGSLEGVYTDPYLYKRDGNVDYIVAWRESNNTAGNINGTGIKYHKYYLGYKYGGDSIVANLNLGFTDPTRYTVSLHNQLRFKGLVGIDTPWSTYSDMVPPMAPSTTIEIGDKTISGPVEVTLVVEPSFSLQFGYGLSCRGRFSFITQWHRNHASYNGALFDFQMALSLKYEL